MAEVELRLQRAEARCRRPWPRRCCASGGDEPGALALADRGVQRQRAGCRPAGGGRRPGSSARTGRRGRPRPPRPGREARSTTNATGEILTLQASGARRRHASWSSSPYRPRRQALEPSTRARLLAEPVPPGERLLQLLADPSRAPATLTTKSVNPSSRSLSPIALLAARCRQIVVERWISAGSRPTFAHQSSRTPRLVRQRLRVAEGVPDVGVLGDDPERHLLAAAADQDRDAPERGRVQLLPAGLDDRQCRDRGRAGGCRRSRTRSRTRRSRSGTSPSRSRA